MEMRQEDRIDGTEVDAQLIQANGRAAAGVEEHFAPTRLDEGRWTEAVGQRDRCSRPEQRYGYPVLLAGFRLGMDRQGEGAENACRPGEQTAPGWAKDSFQPVR